MKVADDSVYSAKKGPSAQLLQFSLARRRRRRVWPSFVRPTVAVFMLFYTYYCDYMHGYWSVYNNEEVLTKGLFRGAADWDQFRTFCFNRSHIGLAHKEFFLKDTFMSDDQHGYFDKVCADNPLACSSTSGDAFGSDVVTCMLMSGKMTKFIHDACWWSSTSGSAFITYAYIDVARQASLASGGANTDYMKFTYKFDGNVDFDSEFVRGTYDLVAKTVPGGILTTSVSHSFRGHVVALSDCTHDGPKDFCSGVRAFLQQSGNIVSMSYVKYFEFGGELIAVLPHFDEESVYSVVQSQNLFMDNLGLDGIGPGTRPWANPLIYGRYKTSSGGFRYGILAQVIILELLVGFRAVVAHPILPNDWAVVMSGLSSHAVVVIEMLVYYYSEIYYLRNTMYNIVVGGAEGWVYGLVVCQSIEIFYIVLSLEPFVMQNYYGDRDCTILKGKKLVAHVGYVTSVLAVVLTLTEYNTSPDARTSIRSAECPGKAVSCGWRDCSTFHVVIGLYIAFGLGVQVYHSVFTYRRRFDTPITKVSTFERICVGADCNALSGQRITSSIDGKCVFPIRALCGFGFTYARNGDLFRTKDVLYYTWLLYAPKHFDQLLDISVVMWMCTGQVECGKLNVGMRITRRPRVGDQSNLAWLA